jgi:hypothetical protein
VGLGIVDQRGQGHCGGGPVGPLPVLDQRSGSPDALGGRQVTVGHQSPEHGQGIGPAITRNVGEGHGGREPLAGIR